MTAKAKVTYHRLTPGARSEIQWSGIGVAEYIRAWCPDGQWTGDACGCPDDRCRDGFHHERHEDCGCLAALLRSAVESGRIGYPS